MTLKAAAHACKRAARSAAVVTLSSWPRLEAPLMAVPGDQAAGCGTDAAALPGSRRPTHVPLTVFLQSTTEIITS
jgi:hypothetical protein